LYNQQSVTDEWHVQCYICNWLDEK